MKKTAVKKIIALLAGCLIACGQPSSFTAVEENNTISITAENSSTVNEATAELTVKDGEITVITSEIESGGIEVTIRSNEAADSDAPAYNWIFEQLGETEIQLSEGTYEVLFEVVFKGTYGSISIHQKTSEIESDEGDGQNPVMNFIGDYMSDRCTIHVEASGKDEAVFTVNWGSSGTERTIWTMSGPLDPDTLTVTYSNAVKTDIVLQDDNLPEQETVLYKDGKGSFAFQDASLIWDDETEHQADGMIFQWAEID